MEINRVDFKTLITVLLLAQALSCIPPRHIGSLAFVCTLVFGIADSHIFGPVHSKPPAMKIVHILRSD